MRQSMLESSADADATDPCCKDENHVRDSEIPSSPQNAGPPSPPPPSLSELQPETVPKSPMKETLQEGLNDRYDAPKDMDAPQDLAGSQKMVLFCHQEGLGDHGMVDSILQANSVMSPPVANTTDFECKSKSAL